ncbi:MAG: ferrous iron transport protein B [Proteobacteria bacterium]|nr:ferrous iron transport protein B [Pseudomonadota bacterium]
MSDKVKPLTIALAGNPNCGKTTVFNGLTGANQHVGNYSGVTVESRSGSCKINDQEVEVVDLPGTYSLNSHSPEERVAQDELLSGKFDILVTIIDTTSISRSLLFVAQLMQLKLPMILVLNMWDEVEKSGMQLDVEQMKALLGMPVIKTIGSKRVGIDELKEAIVDPATREIKPSRLRLGDVLTNAIHKIEVELPENYHANGDWTATRLLLNDHKYVEEIMLLDKGARAVSVAKGEREHIEADTAMDIELYVTEQYAGFADGLLREVQKAKPRENAREMSDRIDKVLAHPVFGLILFFVIIALIFFFTFLLGNPASDFINDNIFGGINEALSGGDFEKNNPVIHSILTDGIIAGVGGVLGFTPLIVLLFLGISFLEDTGYMARTAYLVDKFMHKLGLHGRSLIPMITGIGCSVPGIMATRTIAGKNERLATMFVLPFISCGARQPIWLLLIPIFFPGSPLHESLILLSIYIFSFLFAFFIAFLLRKTVFKGEEEPFVMELPPYRMPTLRAVIMHMWERTWLYVKKAGTIILSLSIILWAAGYFPRPNDEEEQAYTTQALEEIRADKDNAENLAAFDAVMKAHENEDDFELAEYQTKLDEMIAEQIEKDELDEEEDADKIKEIEEKLSKENPTLVADKEQADAAKELQNMIDNKVEAQVLDHSVMGIVGHTIAPIFKPLGFDWKVSTAVLASLAAKEVFVSQMGIIYALGEVEPEENFDEVNVEDNENEGAKGLRKAMSSYDKINGIALIIFMLLTSPCIASLAVAKRESNSWKFAAAQFFGMFAIAWVLAMLVNVIGHLFA